MRKNERNEKVWRPPSTAGRMCYPLSKPRSSTFKIILIIEELINALPLFLLLFCSQSLFWQG